MQRFLASAKNSASSSGVESVNTTLMAEREAFSTGAVKTSERDSMAS